MLRPRLIAALGVCALLLSLLLTAASPAQTDDDEPAQAAPSGPRVIIAFLPARERKRESGGTIEEQQARAEDDKKRPSTTKVLLKRFQNRPDLRTIGFNGATQGNYSDVQALLDMSAGTRTSAATYNVYDPTPVEFRRTPNGGAVMEGWDQTLRRAHSAPQSIEPGLLASSIPGGAGYVGMLGRFGRNYEAILATNRQGRIAAASLGSPETVAQRAIEMSRRQRFVVASLPPKRMGGRELDELLAARGPDDMVIAMQAPPDFRSTQLLPMGIAAPGFPDGRVTSASTRRDGIIAGIDVPATVLSFLGLKIPSDMKGQPITTVPGGRDVDALDELRGRLTGLAKRRIPSLTGMVLGWLTILFALGAAGGWHRTRRRGLRLGALAFMWIPTMVLVSAAIGPQRAIQEMAIIAVGSFVLAAITDRLLAWPRGPILPAAVGLGAVTIDLVRDSALIVTSLLGPNPRFGSRYFGIGNEMEAALPVLLFVGLAAALSYAPRSRRNAAIFAISSLILLVIMGSGRLGADAGGVITMGVGGAVATVLMLPGVPRKRTIAAIVLVPIAAVGLLAGVDLATGGNGHFTRSVLQADSFESLWEVVSRRYTLAVDASLRGRMPFIALAGLLAIAFAWRNRKWLYENLPGPAWRAMLFGSLAAGVAGSATNDSGALLFVVTVFSMGCVTAYLQGDPRLAADAERVAPTEAPTYTDVLADETEDGRARERAEDRAPAARPAGVS